jgi:hypothetical protein
MTLNAEAAMGRAPDDLTLDERFALAGKWIALELYAPTSLVEIDGKPQVGARLRRIEAIGDSAEECIRKIEASGRSPGAFEYSRLKPPWGGYAG